MEDTVILPSQLHNERRIFVTGVYGSGKTTYARAYAKMAGLKFIDFDLYFSYADTLSALRHSSDECFLNILSDNFITDAIPWSPKTGSSANFKVYAAENNVRIVCCFCPDKNAWARRLVECKKLEVTNDRYSHYIDFYLKLLVQYMELNISYYDTLNNQYVTKECMFERMSWIYNK